VPQPVEDQPGERFVAVASGRQADSGELVGLIGAQQA
jgi:hypothetical protein